ncbi:MAG: DUF2628 domain-containing protein [Rhodospirillaceae bacterium]
MKTFTVHLREASELNGHPELVPETFSFGAFFGLFFWTIYHRCWIASLGIILLEIILWCSQSYFQWPMEFSLISQFFLSLFIGFTGQDFRRAALEARGLKIEAIVSGVSIEAALLRWRDQTIFEGSQKEIVKKVSAR